MDGVGLVGLLDGDVNKLINSRSDDDGAAASGSGARRVCKTGRHWDVAWDVGE